LSTEGSGASRAGEDGIHNEDAFLVEEGLGLYVVCDGASGTPAGEVASRVAAEALERFVEDAEAEFGGERHEGHGALAVVVKAMDHAIAALAAAEQSGSERLGLTTTITLLLAHGRHGVIGHRGDSRAYLIRRGRCHQLTLDHELTDSISDEDSDERNFDVFSLELKAGDTFILCTDGAEDVVQDRDIIRVAGDLTPQLVASRIVSAAHRRSPTVDATAVVVRVRSERESGWLELSSLPKGTAFGHTLFRE
jgi:protein phosphatase